MNGVALSGSDTAMLNNRILSDVADGDWLVMTFPNKIAAAKTGKNGNTIYAYNATGQNFEMVVRLIRGSSDDQFLNGLLVQQQSNFAAFPLMIGSFVKQIGDGLGNITSDTYILSGMVFEENIGAKSNAEGDTEQSVAVYHFRGSKAPRAIT